MTPAKYILIDGEFHLHEERWFTCEEMENKIFSEKIRAIRNSFPFFRECLEIIKLKGIILNCALPDVIENNGLELLRQMERTLVKNKHFKSAVLTILFFTSEVRVRYLIKSEEIPEISYEINTKGLFVELFDKVQKPISSLSNLSLGSEMIWSIANEHLRSSKADQFVITNIEQIVVEVAGSSLFAIKENSIYYPDIDSGAFVDVICPVLHQIFDSMKIIHNPKQKLTVDDLLDADEFFIANSIEGIRWVVGFQEKRYFNRTVKRINEELNKTVLV